MSWLTSKLKDTFKPGSLSSCLAANSWSAHAGLSRSACILCVVSAQIVRSSVRDRSSTTSSPDVITNLSDASTLPITCVQFSRPWAAKVDNTESSSSLLTCNTAPSSSLNKVAKTSCSDVLAILARSTCTPQWPAKAISARVTTRPPSPLSW